MLPCALDAPLVSAKIPQVKLLVSPAFLVNFKMLQVNLRVNSALKIRKVKKQIRPNAIPVALAKSQKKAVLNALNVRLEERALAAKSVWKIFIVIQQ